MVSLHKYFSTCLNCGSFFVQDSLFCISCEKSLFQKALCDKPKQIKTFSQVLKLYSLFQWFPNENRPLSKLLMNLKGGSPLVAYRFYSYVFLKWRLKQTETEFLKSKKIFFVPCPSRNKQKNDHALVLAEEFAKVFQGNLGLFLINLNENEQKQKKLNKKERALKRTLTLDSQKSSSALLDKDVDQFVFVDDIVTTGFTAYQAYLCLGSPKNFEIWSLAYRCLLEPEKFL